MANETKRNKELLQNTIITLLLLVVAFLAYELLCIHHKAPESYTKTNKAPTPIIKVQALTPQTVTLKKSYIGLVTPTHSVEVLPFINGFIEKIIVQNGQFVTKGQTLAVIEQGEYLANLEVADSNIAQAKAVYENANTYYNRLKSAGEAAVSQADFDKAKADYLTAKATVQKAKADYFLQKVYYDYTIIKAPISGWIGTINPSDGDYVSAMGEPLFTIIQTSPIDVVFSITDKEYVEQLFKNGSHNLFKDSKIQLELSNGKIYPETGKFLYMENELNKATNSVAIYAGFKNQDNILLSNAYVTVLLKKTVKNVFLIPENLVQLTPKGKFITLATKEKILTKKVKILGEKDGHYIVKNTFNRDDFLVVEMPPRMPKNSAFKLHLLANNHIKNKKGE